MAATIEAERLFEVGDAARLVGISVPRMRQLEQEGKVPPARRTATGTRLYTNKDIEVIRAARAAQHRGEPALTG